MYGTVSRYYYKTFQIVTCSAYTVLCHFRVRACRLVVDRMVQLDRATWAPMARQAASSLLQTPTPTRPLTARVPRPQGEGPGWPIARTGDHTVATLTLRIL